MRLFRVASISLGVIKLGFHEGVFYVCSLDVDLGLLVPLRINLIINNLLFISILFIYFDLVLICNQFLSFNDIFDLLNFLLATSMICHGCLLITLICSHLLHVSVRLKAE